MKDTQTYREPEGDPKNRNSNMQTKQPSTDLSPADGGEGFVGSNTGTVPGLKIIQGKKGYSDDLPIWEQKSSFTQYQDNTGSEGNAFSHPGQDPTDEYASYKKVQQDEGLPQTFRNSKGAGDAGPDGSDEPDKNGIFSPLDDGGGNPNTQSVPGSDYSGSTELDMPQTEFTRNDESGGGAPRFKFSGQTPPESLYRPKPRD